MPGSPSATAVARLSAPGLRPRQVAERLGLSAAAVTHHLRRLGAETGRGYAGRRLVRELLGRAGLRVGELCEARLEDELSPELTALALG